ncbi:nuclear transport factor 2 family protein [Peredibacter starrii]|uniref:Nuclear transport factor 2 family protein n=1 Tax=Peredibacter starrii TaxID=28202 RepID=A0AAX4HJ04_9BACT|nr:nuclear transport factor 2 family protein [Peredibacter starrii]WPU63209.1 nuclear transport factor 2 family protein [Peredibacter starrii]
MTISKERMIELAQGQLEAYNERNIEKFVAFYHPEVQVWRLGAESQKTCDNIKTFKEMYRERFEKNPELHCELRSRTVLNDSVLDEEWVTGVTGAQAPSHVVAIYGFRDDLIGYVWFTR